MYAPEFKWRIFWGFKIQYTGNKPEIEIFGGVDFTLVPLNSWYNGLWQLIAKRNDIGGVERKGDC